MPPKKPHQPVILKKPHAASSTHKAKPRTSSEVRAQFIAFFEERGHRFVRSSPVVPQNDPTLMFTNAGMNQFKDVFLGKGDRPYTRAVNAQKCIRASGKHNDLEDVGRDHYHHTFFEMLGNWSFGDYFKREAITWAWELLIEHWGLDEGRIWATVFGGETADSLGPDVEAEGIWLETTSLPKERVVRFGRKDNFWEMGDVGPCGPCSELHYDLGKDIDCPSCHSKGVACEVNADGCWRFIELWNLVFIQFNRRANRKLEVLPEKHVDTGMGLERITRVLNGQTSNYQTDLFTPLLERVQKLSNKPCTEGEDAVAARVLADHARTLCFAIADGVMPSNEGRGYVLRRMLRRAARFAHLLGLKEPALHQLASVVAHMMGEAYPEVKMQLSHIQQTLQFEEENFRHTLHRGLVLFEKLQHTAKKNSPALLAGEDVFKLYDTFGFPVDLTQLLADEQGLKIDVARFEECMEQQRVRARNAAHTQAEDEVWHEVLPAQKTRFEGYDVLDLNTRVQRWRMLQGRQVEIVLEKTCFYPEGGGQEADSGWLKMAGFQFNVEDVQRDGDYIVHTCSIQTEIPPNLLEKAFRTASSILCHVDPTERRNTTCNHTATHLLHAALRQVLGKHVRQAGSIVHPQYLRFDFTHPKRVSGKELRQVEKIVNREIRKNTLLDVRHTTYDHAVEEGVMALFGEKYDDEVRVVGVGQFSNELCGGCHVGATGEIGVFSITAEGAVAAGIRRITALSGVHAEMRMQQHATLVEAAKKRLHVPEVELVNGIERLLEQYTKLEQTFKQTKRAQQFLDAADLAKQQKTLHGVQVLISQVEVADGKELRIIADSVRKTLPEGVILLGAAVGDKASLLCSVSQSLTQKGLHAGNIVDGVARIAGGRGGGSATMAMAGAKQPNKLSLALDKASKIVTTSLLDT